MTLLKHYPSRGTIFFQLLLAMLIFQPVLADDFQLADEFLEGSSSTQFIIDTEDEAGPGDFISLQYGQAVGETLVWDVNNSRFRFSDSVRIEGNGAVVGQLFVADNHDINDSDGTLNLGKSGGAFESISWSDTDQSFGFTGNIDLNSNEIIEGRIENLASAPTCDTANAGRLYHDTSNNNSFVCNGTSYVQIDSAGGGGTNGWVDDGTTVRLETATDEVGIGTTSTDRPLTIQGADAATEWISFKDTVGTTRWHVNLLNGNGFNFVESGVADGRLFLEDGGNIGIGTLDPDSRFDIQANGEVMEAGTGIASDIFMNFNDGSDRNFGWDDSENALSTFNQQLRFRNRQTSTTPPDTCSATIAGMQWMDTTSGIVYVCDTSNGRNKWLSLQRLSWGFGRNSGNTNNEYLRQFNGALSSDNGWRMPRNGTITALAAQSNASQSWTFEIRKNDSPTVVTSITISGAEGNTSTGLNIDFNQGDSIQGFCNCSSIDFPQAWFEFAWRK